MLLFYIARKFESDVICWVAANKRRHWPIPRCWNCVVLDWKKIETLANNRITLPENYESL